jgi:GTP-binding protein HflX
VLVGLADGGGRESLEELALLAETAGARVSGRVFQRRSSVTAGTFVSRGKLEALSAIAADGGADLFIFDDDLTPGQVKQLEDRLERKILDRSELILDIFADRARSREAKLQVELAQLTYLLPRLTKMWQHLSRTGGGIGTRGPGETQLEVDRRRVRERIATLRRKLDEVEREREVQRRRRRGMLRVALVGYTNAGKSTLMNALTRATIPTRDRLFETLEATTRRLYLGEGRTVLLTDTVGFIRKLPHHLVASFHSTLEEVTEADLLLHVADASHPAVERQVEQVEDVLEQIGAERLPGILLFNKADAVGDEDRLRSLRIRNPGALQISARSGEGLPALRERLLEFATIEKEATA